jgi:NitT/TauT family transport system ATP-binding protein
MASEQATAVRTTGDGVTAPSAVIQLRDVTKSYKTEKTIIHALARTTLSVAPGEFVSIVGPSGCGKSTLLKLVAGLLPASSGSLVVNGREVTKPVTDAGVVFQSDLLMDWRTVIDNVLIQGEFRKLDKKRTRARAMELLEMVGLTDFADNYPHELSGGMRQRVSICRALLHEPPLLLMDEPFGALDAMTRDQMAVDIQRILKTTSSTVLFITHSIAEAIFLSDRVLVFGNAPGQIVDEVRVDIPRPRRMAVRETTEFGGNVQRVRNCLSAMGIIREDF